MNLSSSYGFMSFTSNNVVDSTKEFLASGSFVAKLAFLFLVIFLFIVCLKIGIYLITVLLKPTSPQIINGMVDGKQLLIFPQDPSSTNSVLINRSNNASSGIEFTWSVWLYIDNINYNAGSYKHIFSKGNDTLTSDPNKQGMIFPDNAPGLYLDKNTNNLVVVMNTFLGDSPTLDNVVEEIVVEDIPVNKWFNVMIIVENKNVDVFINGMVSKSVEIQTIPKQNYGNIYVGFNGGFDGNLSNLWYYDYCLGTYEIQNMMLTGPNLSLSSNSTLNKTNADYLSLRWYFGDGYY